MSNSSPQQLTIWLPPEVMERLKKIEKKYKITLQDVILRAIIKVIEEFEVE